MKSKFNGNRCFLCGRECVPAKDALGEPYMGCPVCRVTVPKPAAPPTEEAPMPADPTLPSEEELARIEAFARERNDYVVSVSVALLLSLIAAARQRAAVADAAQELIDAVCPFGDLQLGTPVADAVKALEAALAGAKP